MHQIAPDVVSSIHACGRASSEIGQVLRATLGIRCALVHLRLPFLHTLRISQYSTCIKRFCPCDQALAANLAREHSGPHDMEENAYKILGIENGPDATEQEIKKASLGSSGKVYTCNLAAGKES